MKLMKTAVLATVTLGLSVSAHAQVEMKEDPGRSAYRILYLEIEDGKWDRFEEIAKIMNEISVEAGQKPATIMHMNSGDWPVMVMIPMEGGMAEMDYSISPTGAAWRNAGIKKLGSKEELEALDKEMGELIASSTSELGHTHAPK
ncbi:hypothetical protein [Croceicoccus gelatinilyticus]|uniref:hypothetical protein n=1 Tax=Croceicoccus gelatinilyticus TaxID=2835536 RepID=UPI001BCAC3FD|nr:hypothetical protein [Croceicoccus gelatinilyticus]MBS7670519.1 hypothetical protein [Croceicoccus gelatinilyticus]